MSFFDPQNPGIGGLKELTSTELALVQALAALGDPNNDRLIGWDDTDNAYAYFTLGSGLTYTHATHTLSASGSSGITIGTTAITSGTTTRILYNNAGVVGEYTITGTGTVVAMATSPVFTTPSLGVATATSINGNTFTTGTYTLTGTAAKTLNFTNTLTLSGTDSTTITFQGTDTYIGRGTTDTITGVKTFNTSTIKQNNPAGTFAYTIVPSAIVAARNLTIPLLTADDTLAVLGLAQTYTAASTYTGAAPQITLGVNTTTLGSVKMFGNTSGDATVRPAAVAGTATVVTLPNASSTLPIYPQQITYTGITTARTVTYPDANFTVARTDAANTFTGVQTFSTPIATGSVATMTATVGGGVPTPPNNTTTFLRGDGTFATPSASAATCLTIIPYPNGCDTPDAPNASLFSVNTTMNVRQVVIPFKITANKISFRTGSNTTPGTLSITLYSEDGQSQIFSVTTASISAPNTIVETALSAVVINPGIYWIAVNPNGTASLQAYCWAESVNPWAATNGLLGNITSKPVIAGTVTITASTVPATITPGSVTVALNKGLIFRLDN